MLADLSFLIREHFPRSSSLECAQGLKGLGITAGSPNDPPEPLSYQLSGMSFGSRPERHMLGESRRCPALSTAAPFYHLSPSDTGDKLTSLLQPHEPGSGTAEAQLLLQQLAGIIAQNPRADHAL